MLMRPFSNLDYERHQHIDMPESYEACPLVSATQCTVDGDACDVVVGRVGIWVIREEGGWAWVLDGYPEEMPEGTHPADLPPVLARGLRILVANMLPVNLTSQYLRDLGFRCES